MEIKKDQEYLVLEKFSDCGAHLEKNQIITIVDARSDTQIFIDVLNSVSSWVISGKSIRDNCALMLPGAIKLAPKETKKEKIQIKRYDKKEFTLKLKDMI